jgi:anti-sigma regulatory factor (Ser/Thr protein kinase)
MFRPGRVWVQRTSGRSTNLSRAVLESPQTRIGRARISTDFGIAAAHGATAAERRAALGPMTSSTHNGVDDGLSLRLSGGPEAGASARRALSRLRADIDPPLMETLRLLVTELVTNSVRHAGAETVLLKVLVGRSAVLTEVTDEGSGFDPAQTGRPRADRTGWGLFLVERLADRWGVNQERNGTRVWFELRRG